MLARTLILVVGSAGLLRCAHAPASPPGEPDVKVAFDRFDVVTGYGHPQTVLTGFFFGSARAEMAVIRVDSNGDPRLRIYGLGDDTWEPWLERTLSQEVEFVDVVRVGDRDRLVMYEDGRLSWLDIEASSERPLVAVRSDFDPPPDGGVPHVDITRDVNHDGRDDLAVPNARGFHVLVQTPAGGFADPVRIRSPRSEWVSGARGFRHNPWLQGGVYEVDYDLDGRSDLVSWNARRFEVYRQDARGRFGEETLVFHVPIPLDGGLNPCSRRPELGFDSFRACYEADHTALTRGDRLDKRVHSLTDVDGDGIADLVVYSLSGTNVLNVRSTYEVHFGSRTTDDRGIAFASEAATSIASDGVQIVLEEHDVDRDGNKDFVITTIRLGFLKVLASLLTRSITLDVGVHRMVDRAYRSKPDTLHKIELHLSESRQTSVLVGDVTGDQVSDLVLGKGRGQLNVFVGVAGPRPFAMRPFEIRIDSPNDERYMWLSDLDRDGVLDILIHRPSTTKPHRVTILMARSTP